MEEKKVKGLPLNHLFTDGRAAMTAFLWAAMALAAITHFFLSSWIAVLLTPPNATSEELATAIQIKAIFQFGAAFSFTVGWLLDKYGINAVVSVLVLAAPTDEQLVLPPDQGDRHVDAFLVRHGHEPTLERSLR